jgi:MFS family permease
LSATDLPERAPLRATREPERAYPRPAYAWYVVAILLAAYILSFIDREVITLLVPGIKRSLSISDTQMALLFGGAFAIFYTVLGVVLGWVADNGNRRWLIFCGVTVWSAMTMACGAAMSFTSLFLARLGVGAGEASLTPSALSILKDYFPPNRLGRAIGLYSAGVSSGGGIAFIIGGTLYPAVLAAGAQHWPLFGRVEPWQQMFIWVGLPGVVMALLVLTIREPLRREAIANGPATRGPTVPATLRFVFQRWRAFIVLYLGISVLGIMAYGVGFWIPEFLRRTYHLDPAELGSYIRWRGVIVIPFGLIGAIFGGWLADRFQRRHDDGYVRVCLISYVLLGIGYVGLTLMPTPTLALLMLIPGTLGGAMPTAAGSAAIVAIAPASMRAQITALYYFAISFVGFFVGTTSVGLLTDRVFHDESKLRYSLALVAGVSVLAGLWLLNYNRRYFRAQIAELRREATG